MSILFPHRYIIFLDSGSVEYSDSITENQLNWEQTVVDLLDKKWYSTPDKCWYELTEASPVSGQLSLVLESVGS